MAYQRLAYDDASPSTEMTTDCRAAEAELQLPLRDSAAERTARAAMRPAPSILFEDYPREVAKPSVAVSDAAARLAAALHLHLD